MHNINNRVFESSTKFDGNLQWLHFFINSDRIIKADKGGLMQKVQEVFEKVQTKARKFLYSDIYIWLVLAIVLIAWWAQNATFGFVTLILVSCFALVFADDILPLTVNIFGAVLMIYDDTVAEFVYLWPTFIPLVLAIGWFIVRNVRGKKRFVMGKMFFPQIAVSFALLIGGVGVVESGNYLDSLPICIALGLGVLLVYLLYANFTKRDSNVLIPEYFAKVMLYIGVVIGIQLIISIIRANVPLGAWSGAYWDFGWGNRNNVATYLVICAPMGLYLSTRKRHPFVYYLISAFEYVCLVMTLSRGGILFGIIGAIAGIVLSVIKAEDRKKSLISLGIVIAIIGVVVGICHDWAKGLVTSLMNRVTEKDDVSSGRFDLYKEAWELFKQYPLLGGGMGHVGTNAGMKNEMGLYWFHSTLFQIIGCMGLVGVLAYGYYYATKIYLLVKRRKSVFALFILVIWIGFEGYSLIDTGTMSPYPNMMLIMVTTFLLELVDDKHDGCVAGISNTLSGEVYQRELSLPIEQVIEESTVQ